VVIFTVAWKMSPVPFIAATIRSFTVSIIPGLCCLHVWFPSVSLLIFVSSLGWLARFRIRTSQQQSVRLVTWLRAPAMVMLLITLVTPLMSVTELGNQALSASFLAMPVNVTTPSVVSTDVSGRWSSDATAMTI